MERDEAAGRTALPTPAPYHHNYQPPYQRPHAAPVTPAAPFTLTSMPPMKVSNSTMWSRMKTTLRAFEIYENGQHDLTAADVKMVKEVRFCELRYQQGSYRWYSQLASRSVRYISARSEDVTN